MSTRGFLRRDLLALAVGGVAAAALPGRAGAQDTSWPERPITFVCGFGPGGSADRTARALAQFLGPEIGRPVTVVNRPGAGGQAAAAYVLAQPDDGYTILATSISPYLQNSIINTRAPYKLEDFAFINGQWSDWDLIAVNNKVQIGSLAELMTSIKENPGRHSVSVVPSSAGQITVHILLDALQIPTRNLRIVTYDSGGAARAAAAGGQVDFTVLGGEGTEAIRDMVRPLAVVNDTRVEGWDAPPLNEALKPLGVEVPVLSGSIRGLAAKASFKTQHPDRWAKLISAYERTLQNPEARQHFKANGIGADWLGPERTTEIMQRTYDILARYKDVGR